MLRETDVVDWPFVFDREGRSSEDRRRLLTQVLALNQSNAVGCLTPRRVVCVLPCKAAAAPCLHTTCSHRGWALPLALGIVTESER